MADDGPSHVRWADEEDFPPVRSSSLRRERARGRVDPRIGPGSSYDEDTYGYEEDRRVRGSSDGPYRRRQWRIIDAPQTQAPRVYPSRSSTDSRRQQMRPEPVAAEVTLPERYTESPTPIDNEEQRWRPRVAETYETRERVVRRERPDSPSIEEEGPPRSEFSRGYYTREQHEFPPPRRMSLTSEDWDAYDRFEFVQPSRSLTESSKEGASDTESSESEGTGPQRQDTGRTRNTRARAVDSSSYTGNAELGGTHTASLTILHDSKGQRPALFRWLHVRQEMMNFDELWTEVSRLPGLSDIEKGALAKLRADVKKSCVKSRHNPKGDKVGYMDPRFVEVPLQSMNKKGSSSGTLTPGSARWICLPYFSLGQYSGLLSASNLSSFPPQTLLQAQNSRNTLQRDMEQAVCQLGTAQRGECFHIAQLWCIIIDNSLLVTCGSMVQADLERDILSIDSQPSRNASAASGQGRILVHYGESVIWELSTNECSSWFSFISHFQAFWPQRLEFWHKEQLVTAHRWQRILGLANKSRSSVKLVLKLVSRPEPPQRAVLAPLEQSAAGTGDVKKAPTADESFHVLALCQSGSVHLKKSSDDDNDDDDDAWDNLKVQLQEADNFLTHQTAFTDRKTFKACEGSSRSEVYTMLANMATQVDENGADEMRRLYEERIDVYNAASILYDLFLPKDLKDPTSKKYWGAVKEMARIPELQPDYVGVLYDSSTTGELRTSLRVLSQDVMAFQSVMSYASEKERAGVTLPREFVTGWLYMVMAMVYGAANQPPWSNRFMRAKDLIAEGMQKIVQEISDRNLLEKVVVMPLEVFSLTALGLLQDQVGKSDDIFETYSQYLDSLDTDIISKPSDRTYQHRIDLVRQEFTAVKRTIGRQRMIINCTRNSLTSPDLIVRYQEDINPRRGVARDMAPSRLHERGFERRDYGPIVERTYTGEPMGLGDDFVDEIASASKLSPIDAGGLRGLLLTECSRFVEQREFEFRRLEEYADELERDIAYKMNWTKDKQENAIFAFTLVTIIFLPLSAVSSIFGMNTADVRDMEASQWLYWAISLPLTLVIIVAGLWWMGELPNIAKWIMRKPREVTRGYSHGPPVVPQGASRVYASAAAAPSALVPVTEYGATSYAPSMFPRRRSTTADDWYTPQAIETRRRPMARRVYS